MNIREEISKLSKSEKILLVEEIWDEISKDSDTELSDAQKNEIERRLSLVEEGQVKYFTLAEVRARIKSLKKNVQD